MIAFEVEASELVETLRVMSDRQRDFRDPLTEVLTLAAGDAAGRVAAHGGGRWEPMHALTPVVARVLYEKDRDPSTLMVDSGDLLRSFEPGGPGNVLEVGPTEGLVGSRLAGPRSDYAIARWQQEGTRRTFQVLQGEGFSEPGIPGREMLFWDEGRLQEYDGIFASHLFLGTE